MLSTTFPANYSAKFEIITVQLHSFKVLSKHSFILNNYAPTVYWLLGPSKEMRRCKLVNL